MEISVKLFGQIADVAGINSIMIKDIANTDELRQKLQAEYPALLNSKFAIAVNKNIIQSNTVLQEKAEVALLPPFSGG